MTVKQGFEYITSNRYIGEWLLLYRWKSMARSEERWSIWESTNRYTDALSIRKPLIDIRVLLLLKIQMKALDRSERTLATSSHTPLLDYSTDVLIHKRFKRNRWNFKISHVGMLIEDRFSRTSEDERAGIERSILDTGIDKREITISRWARWSSFE